MPMSDQIELTRDCDVIAVPSGMRQTLPRGMAVRIVQTRGGAFTVSNDIHAIFRIDGTDADALGLAAPSASTPAAPQGPLNDQMIWNALKTVYDPELPVNVVDLGLIYSCAVTSNPTGKSIAVRMAMTSPGCGMSNVLKADVESRLLRLPEVTEAHVEVVFDPPWTQARMSEGARLQLGMDLDGRASPALVQITRN